MGPERELTPTRSENPYWVPGSAPEKGHELFDRQSGVGDDVTECAGPDLPVVRHHDAGMRYVPPQNHVTSRLPPKDETRAFQGRADISPGKVRG
jgi:hypothetical protein